MLMKLSTCTNIQQHLTKCHQVRYIKFNNPVLQFKFFHCFHFHFIAAIFDVVQLTIFHEHILGYSGQKSSIKSLV